VAAIFIFAEQNNHAIDGANAQTIIITTLAGIALTSGTSGTRCTVALCGDGGPATSVQLNAPNIMSYSFHAYQTEALMGSGTRGLALEKISH
jgi:hypothetical protein